MSRTLPFQRSPQAARARLAKAQLLPIPRSVADDLALRAHLSFEAIRGACDHIGPAQHITEVVLLGKFLSEAGHGEFSHESLLAADRAMAEVFRGGRKAGTWRVSSRSAFALLAAVVSMYDRQLHSATLGALTTASDRLDRFKGGEAYQPLQTRRA
ncbi:hypothetical protein [Caballeronia novacaledonica]|uniref:Fis family transcriptional regulator n=1 Tax=Caballeronia novacaledonica TaxID=1544861 RepID=A0AA37IHJ4_9BURK|nr:hypothetical protein [Caballeronia novacaledonica]GJH26891.1 hypothetical protein CBA19CS42_20265 [Caballeronia novacaledonica]